ncbi:MAG TPA: FAD-dependent monooxygenase, partial [Planctomycetaceae bacterium]|nr:FAD-dependent monooxygenase [Planctomycetaceae bacterium]
AGPTGLMLAIELTIAGARVTVLERLADPDDTIKAGGLGALAGEALERRGFGPAMDAEETAAAESMQAMTKQAMTGQAMTGQAMTGQAGAASLPALPWKKFGGHFAGLFLIDQTRQREPERRLRGVRQQALERMLGERARDLGIDVRRCHEVAGFREVAGGIEVDVRGPDGPLTLKSAYLVGCDGGRSLVRKLAGFEFPGTDPTLTGHQAIVELDHPERLLPLGWRRTPQGMLAYGPVPGRVFTAEFDGPPPDRNAPITIEELQGSLRRVSGADVTITAIKTATRFTDNARQATTYRLGRVLLAGDAAHVHSPFGGQGLNLGILDAVNLGWKLAAVVNGRAPAELLDTYTAERHPVAARVLANTRAQVALMRPDDLTTPLRDIVAEIMRLDEGNRFFGEMMSGITTRYTLGGTHPLVGRLSGNIALNLDAGETQLFSLMSRGNAVLVDAGSGAAANLAADRVPRVRIVRARGGPSLFVRPDGCIAWACDDHNVDGLAAALTKWLGTPKSVSGTNRM